MCKSKSRTMRSILSLDLPAMTLGSSTPSPRATSRPSAAAPKIKHRLNNNFESTVHQPIHAQQHSHSIPAAIKAQPNSVMASTLVEKATAAVEKITGSTTNGESKSARKKKEKAKAAEAASATNGTSPAVPRDASNETSVVPDADGSTEHPYVKELQKQIRNINKKLSGMQKTDSVIAENPGVSLDDLVAQRKLNNDQRSAALKKPGLQAQLADLEERIEHYRKFDSDYQTKFSKQRDDLSAAHAKELTSLREQLQGEAASATDSELRKKLLTFSQFLRAAAAKRTVEEEADSEESRAFEGALLLVYGGDSKAVDTALSIIEGSNEPVPSIEGIPLQVDCKFTSSQAQHTMFLLQVFITCFISVYSVSHELIFVTHRLPNQEGLHCSRTFPDRRGLGRSSRRGYRVWCIRSHYRPCQPNRARSRRPDKRTSGGSI